VDIPRGLLVVLIAASSFAATDAPQNVAALHEVYSAHWSRAAELCRAIVRADPSQGDAWDCLVRALIEDHRADEAYAAADEALKSAPESAGAYTAQGRALYRQGQLAAAETAFQKAIHRDARSAGALAGLVRVRHTVAKHKSAEALATMAYHAAPDDPELILGWANTLKGAEHIEALRRALAIYDPETREAKSLRAHIAADTAVGDRHTRVLESPYRAYDLNLVDVLSPAGSRGIGLRVRFNDSWQGTFLLDTGASGFSLSRKGARKAGLEALEAEGTEVRGIGDRHVPDSFHYLAETLRIGDLVLGNCPVSVFDAAKESDADGLIGADVFSRFIVQIDWPRRKLRLLPYPGLAGPPEEPRDSDDQPAAGFQRIYVVGHALLIPTFIDDEPRSLFMVDTGSNANIVNVAVARGATKVHSDSQTVVRGIQGRVKDISRADRVRLTFANFRQDNVGVLVMDLTHVSDSGGVEIGGVLGMPVLSQLVLTIDYRNAAIRLTRDQK